MTGSSLWFLLNYTVPSAIGALLCLALLIALAKRPSRLLACFCCFYLLSIAHLAGVFVTSLLSRTDGTLSLQSFWSISRVMSFLRYVPLVLFVHSFHRFRITPALTGLLAALIVAAIVLPFFVYSIIPELVEIVVVLYSFSHLLAVHVLRGRLSVTSRLCDLLRAVLACSGFFLIGVLLDLVKAIPQASVYVSILLVDFYPVFLVGIGGVMAVWALRDSFRPREPEGSGGFDLSALPVTRREREIIGLMLGGETNASIADRLFISESTVKKHANNLFRKLRISSRWELLKLTGRLPPKE